MARAKRSGLGKGLDSLIPMGSELEEIQQILAEHAQAAMDSLSE